MSMASRLTKGDPSSSTTSTAKATAITHSSSSSTHSSIPSHLSGELAFLESLIQRARDQHRHQPFLQRMREISRLGRLVLRCIQDKRRQFQKAGKGREKLGPLLIKLTHALFRAHRTTCQIIELHHFLPLQLTTIALYARIFTIVLNIGNGIGISAAHLIAGQSVDVQVDGLNNTEERGKDSTKSSSSSAQVDTVKDLDKSTSMYIASASIDLDDIGEKIERRLPTLPLTVSSTTAIPASSPSPSLQKIATKAAAAAAAASASRSPAPLPTSVPVSPTSSLPNDDDQASPRPSSPSVTSHVEQRKQETPSTSSIPIDNADLRKRTVKTTTPNTESKSESTVRASKRSSTDVDLSNKKKLKLKKKKRDTMDDIFGF